MEEVEADDGQVSESEGEDSTDQESWWYEFFYDDYFNFFSMYGYFDDDLNFSRYGDHFESWEDSMDQRRRASEHHRQQLRLGIDHRDGIALPGVELKTCHHREGCN